MGKYYIYILHFDGLIAFLKKVKNIVVFQKVIFIYFHLFIYYYIHLFIYYYIHLFI